MRQSMDDDEIGLLSDKIERHSPKDVRSGRQLDWKIVAIAVLATSNLALLAYQCLPFSLSNTVVHADPDTTKSDVALVPTLPRKPVEFHWYTDYGSENLTTSNALWDRISSAHGLIAVDHSVAAENRWLQSMPVPGDESKGLYLLESYHQLHCLKIVRSVFLESVDDRPLSYPVKHVLHCFDAFRQFVMCHADNTPLYTWGDHTSGDGQIHMCNDWTALRDYATQHSACFQDRVGNETLREQFGRCDDGTDGLE